MASSEKYRTLYWRERDLNEYLEENRGLLSKIQDLQEENKTIKEICKKLDISKKRCQKILKADKEYKALQLLKRKQRKGLSKEEFRAFALQIKKV